ncbi:epoxyqueuosine reductase QueH, partial [Candidatus Fermentibacterales bacterium]|nr:epoxyqueuosine reductase QueH [Candidatus Fermentibacterales bacterium]
CAPCMIPVVEALSGEGLSPVLCYFHNPNIHPLKEHRRRLAAVREYCASQGLTLIEDGGEEDAYPLESNLRMLLAADNRCAACFAERLDATALKAAELGVPCFSTTLLVSPYQNQELIRRAGEAASGRSGVSFLMHDFRSLYRSSVRRSRELGMYRQAYCGCVMSERDRYMGLRSPGQEGSH